MNTASFIPPLLTALLLVLIVTSDVTPPPASPAPGGCADSVISFSPCLPYISSPPNDLSDEPSSQCCEIYDGAFDSGEAECLCYLLRQSTLLGFPINTSKLASLSDLCHTHPSLPRICSGSPSLPPLLGPKRKPPSAPRSPPPPSTVPVPIRPPTKPATPPAQPRNHANHLGLGAPNAVALMCVYSWWTSLNQLV